ncbi:RimK/LysX family protein [Vibrio sp. JC009]|uniref:putative ATP-dependent zinc protease n=1 Tax=Vibrio sp. JC009 TaxID=2912314 RepID=UPI0023B19E8F|nr:RimK/LysX family protein [Vibrio sp. JC009]WED24395.1 RimK/LysX family protein [Vibrio sp. JC009]
MIKRDNLLVIALCGGMAACSSSGFHANQPTDPEVTEPPELIESEYGLILEPDLLEIAEADTPAEKELAVEVKAPEMVPIAEPIPEPVAEEVVIVEPFTEAEPVNEPEPAPEANSGPLKTEEGKLILGSKEWVYVPNFGNSFVARIDAGIASSSASTTDIVHFDRDGQEWVKFKIRHGMNESEEVSLPVIGWVENELKSGEKQPVVNSWIQLGDMSETINLTLVDAKYMRSAFVLGKNFFDKFAVVDDKRQFIQPKVKD